MGYKSVLRSLGAAAREADRNARRRQRDLEQRHKQHAKMQELEQAAYEVEVYENQIDILLSVHKDCGDSWDWRGVKAIARPEEPTRTDSYERRAQSDLQNFKPGAFSRLLGRAESDRQKLADAVNSAKQSDEQAYQEALTSYQSDLAEWQNDQQLAERIVAGDTDAYTEAVQKVDPFSELSDLGSRMRFNFVDGRKVEVTLFARGEQVIPSEVKTLLKTGKLSVKAMTKSRFYELYQDYICGCALRVARELFALLPVGVVIVTVMDDLLDGVTGHMESQPILSVIIPKATISRLDFERIDPSESLKNFVHNVNFGKTKGFSAVQALGRLDIQP